MFSAGVLTAAEEDDDLVTLSDTTVGIYKKLMLRGDLLVGCVLYGDVADGPWYVALMQRQSTTAAWRDHLIFGRDIVEAAPAAPAAQAA